MLAVLAGVQAGGQVARAVPEAAFQALQVRVLFQRQRQLAGGFHLDIDELRVARRPLASGRALIVGAAVGGGDEHGGLLRVTCVEGRPRVKPQANLRSSQS